MIVAVFSLMFASAAFGNEVSRGSYSDEDTVRVLTEGAAGKIAETSARLAGASADYVDIISDRRQSLVWECSVQKKIVNVTIMEAVSKGMQKNKQFTNFQCISNKGQETLEKLSAIENQIPSKSEELIQKGLREAMSFNLILEGFSEYVENVSKTKIDEIKKADTVDARKKILEEVTQKMKLLETVLEQINNKLKDIKFKFFESYIQYSFSTEGTLRNTQRDGTEKIKKCVA